MLSDNGNEFVNAEFRKLLVDLDITAEYTPVDGAKSNGQVERWVGLATEGTRAAWLAFKTLFPGIEFPSRAKSYENMWPEACVWMNDKLNISAQVSKADMRNPELQMFGKWVTQLVLPFLMPGKRFQHREDKLNSKGERCFFLNSGDSHSSRTSKILTPTGHVTYSAQVTFGFYRRPFSVGVAAYGQQEVPSSLPPMGFSGHAGCRVRELGGVGAGACGGLSRGRGGQHFFSYHS